MSRIKDKFETDIDRKNKKKSPLSTVLLEEIFLCTQDEEIEIIMIE